jgi:hypothetical protein
MKYKANAWSSIWRGRTQEFPRQAAELTFGRQSPYLPLRLSLSDVQTQ